MAYIFPINPVDGQLYPNPAIAGSLQYVWSAGQKSWLIYSPLGVQSVSGNLPIVVTNNTSNPVVSILPATVSTPGTLSPEDKIKLDNLPSAFGSVTSVAAGSGLVTDLPSNAPITSSGTIRLLPPSGAAIGGVKAGANVTIGPDGTISVPPGTVTSINCVDGIIAAPNPITSSGTITLRPASNLLIGGVIVGAGLRVDSAGVLTLAGDIIANKVGAWGSFSNNISASPPAFALKEGYNVSSISWQGGPSPRAAVTFQTALPDANYSISLSASTEDYGSIFSTAQTATTLNENYKLATSVGFRAQSTVTSDYSTSGGVPWWNTWNVGAPNNPATGCFTDFEFQIIDTRVNP